MAEPLSALERLHRAAAKRDATVGIRSILTHGRDTATATLATLDVRVWDGPGVPFSRRELVGSVRIVSLRAGVPDLTVEQAAAVLVEQLRSGAERD